MINSLVRSRMVYSCQTWCPTKAQLQRMNSQYMMFIRKLAKGGFNRKPNSYAYIYTNEDLLRIANTTDLVSYIKQQQRNYLCHLVRNDNQSIAKRLLFNADTAKKPGPKTTLLTSVLASERCGPEALFKRAIQREC